MQRKDSAGVALPCSPPGPVSVLLPPSLSVFLGVCWRVRERGEDRKEKRKTRIEGGREGVYVYVYLNASTFIHDYV